MEPVTANGLIVAFVVAVWAAYFVPLVLRRYDDASKTSSLENLSALSRVIPRRERHEEADHDAEEPPAPPVQADAAPQRSRLTRETARRAARRRRNTLLTLLTVVAVVGGLGGFKVIPLVWVAAPAALVVAWLVACRVQVRSEYGAKPRAAGSPRTATRSLSTKTLSKKRTAPASGSAEPSRRTSVDDEVTIVVDGQLEDVDPARRHVMQLEALPSHALDEQLVIAVPSVATTGEALWDPLPVTLPTYVTKPRVGRTVRTIDFSGPGTWTSGHVEGESVELPGVGDAAEGQPRRAAGE